MPISSQPAIRFADRVSRIEVSATIRVTNLVHQLRAAGKEVIDLGAGEPDFNTPEEIKSAAKSALDANFTKYTATSGTGDFLDAVAARYRQDFGVEIETSEITATVGGKQGLFNALMALTGPGDEVVIARPYWVTFPQIVLFAGGRPVFAETRAEDGFRPTAEDFSRCFTERTRVVLLNSPGNPSGSVMKPDEVERLLKLVHDRGILLLSDECYYKFHYGEGPPFSLASAFPRYRDNVAVCASLSKTYAMTGWRMGYVVAARPLIAAMVKIQSHSASHPASIAQKAAVQALTGSQDSLQVMLAEYRKRRDYLVPALNAIPGVSCHCPEGAFYVFPSISDLLGRKGIADSEQFAEALLERDHLAITPGSAFGVEGHIRISYAASMEQIRKGVDALSSFAAYLRQA